MLEIGSLVDGKYKILNEIGHGGMSVVYLAIVERANQTWAIKEVRKNGETKTDIVQQGLVTEMNILKKLNHAHLPRIIDIIDHDDSFLIVMDYIEGVDLDKKLREGPQKWEHVVEWSKQLCDVFAYLHSRKPPIIYRDMKPGNVKLKPDGNVVLFDFGTAREYKSQRAGDDTTCLGTRGYAAPEQYGGMGQTDARSDIYCLGATMYHLVTGQLPGGPPEYIIPPIRSVCPWLPRTGKAGNCVRGLEQIILKCVQPNPANRYQNCAELMYDLENIDKISDDFIKAQKKKVRTWVTTAICSVVFALSGVLLGTLANKTVSNDYLSKVEAAFSPIASTSEVSEASPGYTQARDNLRNAVAVNPSDPDAWLYLAKLFASDALVTEAERAYINSLLNETEKEGYGNGLKKNANGYARFCYEWGIDLFFFYGKDSDTIGKGDPKQATEFLKMVIGNSATDSSTATDSAECIKNLENPTEVNYNWCPDGFVLDKIDHDIASQQFNLAKALYPIASHYEKIGDNQGYKKAYSVSAYITDVGLAINNLEVMKEESVTIQPSIIKNIFYWQTMVTLRNIIQYNGDSGEIENAKKEADRIYGIVKNFESDNTIAKNAKENAVSTYNNLVFDYNAKVGGNYND